MILYILGSIHLWIIIAICFEIIFENIQKFIDKWNMLNSMWLA